jgi:CheY-like chemotaxis protein
VIKHYKIDMQVTQLVNLVANALVIEPKKAVSVPAPKPSEGHPLRSRTILVIDDEPDVCTFLGAVLEDQGAEVIKATSAEEVLKLAREKRPDLITLDISMPGKDGGAVFEELRADADLKTTPVCIITGRPELRKVIYDQNALRPEGYLDKPVDEELLVSTLRRILEVGRDGKAEN